MIFSLIYKALNDFTTVEDLICVMIDLSYRDIQGNLKEKQETANCYVISRPGNYCFPLIYGCGILYSKENLESYTYQGGDKQADFYDYQDKLIKEPTITYKACKIKIITRDSSREYIQGLRISEYYAEFEITNVPDEGANYVIGILDIEDRIIWSWHLWLWKKKLENIEIGKYKILNTNLATKGNKSWYYQWGRKDPICFFDKMVGVRKCSESIGQSIQHPNIFYLHGDNTYNYNWVKKKFYYNYWNSRCNEEQVDERVIKTIYDPCPPGYTIPGYMVFTSLKKDHWDIDRKGWVFNSGKIFFSASGYYNGGCGIVYNVGCGGDYWSAGAAGASLASRLHFNSVNVNLFDVSYRVVGSSVRPVFAS